MTIISQGGGNNDDKSQVVDLEQDGAIISSSSQQKTTSSNPSPSATTNTIRITLTGMQSYIPLKTVEVKDTQETDPSIQQLLQDLRQGPIHKINKSYRIIDAAIATLFVTIISAIIYLAATGQLGDCPQSSPCQYQSNHLPVILIVVIGGVITMVLVPIGVMKSSKATKDIKQLCRGFQAQFSNVSRCTFVDADRSSDDGRDAMIEITLLI